jgi:tetratricopeptide (TPR) repeat protein
MLESCDRALALDPELVSAIAAKGWIEGVLNRNISLGLQLTEKALELDPNYAQALAYRAWVLRSDGRLSESVDNLQAAVELDPHSILYVHALAWSLFCAGRFKDALELERRMAKEMSWIDVSHGYVALMASFLGFDDEAIEAGYCALEVSNNDPIAKAIMAYTLARTGYGNEARRMAFESEAAQLPRAPRSQLAMVYAELGDRQRVIALLREARDEGCPWFPGARYDPRLGDFAQDSDVVKLYD